MNPDDAYKDLAGKIIMQAVMDWRYLCDQLKNPAKYLHKEPPQFSFESLRNFFKSEWCLMLCTHAEPLTILHQLENERKAALKIFKEDKHEQLELSARRKH